MKLHPDIHRQLFLAAQFKINQVNVQKALRGNLSRELPFPIEILALERLGQPRELVQRHGHLAFDLARLELHIDPALQLGFVLNELIDFTFRQLQRRRWSSFLVFQGIAKSLQPVVNRLDLIVGRGHFSQLGRLVVGVLRDKFGQLPRGKKETCPNHRQKNDERGQQGQAAIKETAPACSRYLTATQMAHRHLTRFIVIHARLPQSVSQTLDVHWQGLSLSMLTNPRKRCPELRDWNKNQSFV